MTVLPRLTLADRTCTATPIPVNTLDAYFESYLSYPQERRWQVFFEDVAKQQRVLETVAGDVGLGRDGVRVLEGLAAKTHTWRAYTGLQKVPDVVAGIAEYLDAAADRKVVVLGMHAQVLSELAYRLKKYGSCKLYPGTPPAKRSVMLRSFQTNRKRRVFVAHVRAANVAIELTAANHVAIVEASWTPDENASAILRVHNAEQTRDVTVDFWCMDTGIDRRLQQVMRRQTARVLKDFDAARLDAPEKIDPFED